MNTNPLTDALRSRWTLEGRVPLSGVADGAVWHRARSIATGEDVVLFVVRGESALEAADAVRRAYLVEDPHLLTVKDIVVLDDPRETTSAPLAPAEGPTTVVEYALPPAPPLAALLAKGPLHPETARAIIGEAATGLEAARRRGVRHQFLDSNRVFVDTRSGEVVLLGIGVEAASHPGLDRSREVASFQDTAALVALLYRALTGRSPRHDGSGDVPRPSTIADGPIPEDLDLLCDLVLNESADEIPETTRELIEVLQPWQSIPVTLEAYARETPEPSAGGAPTAAAAAGGGAAAAPLAASAPSADGTQSPAGEPADAERAEPAPTEPEDTAPEDTAPAEPPDAEPESAAEDRDADDITDDELESTALMGAVPDEEEDPEEETDARPGPSAPAAAAAAGAGGAVGAAGAAAQRTSTEAKALVDDLHLDQKRATSPFPGHLDIARTSAPEPAPEPAPESEDAAGAGAAPLAAGGAAAVGAAGAAASRDEPAPKADIPSHTSGTHWPLAGAEAADAPLAPPAEESTRQMPATASAGAAATPDQSAPTPSQPVTHGEDAAAPGPVPVPGRTVPMARSSAAGPIVVQGRGRSSLDEPEESTVPYQRSSLLRDVVGVAVDNDAPETYALGPRDREKRSLQSQWIIIGGAIAVMIALVIALTTITSDIRDILEDPLATSPPATTAPPTEEETGEAPVEPTAEETEEALPAPEIDSLSLIALPDGESPDHTDQEDRLIDGDTSDFWSTQHYASPDYGGLKEGVGIRLQFAESSTFKALTVTTARNNGGLIELRTVNEDGSPGEVLASGELVADGEVRLEAPEEMETDKVMLWIPELPPDSAQQGRFRARIAEIQAE